MANGPKGSFRSDGPSIGPFGSPLARPLIYGKEIPRSREVWERKREEGDYQRRRDYEEISRKTKKGRERNDKRVDK